MNQDTTFVYTYSAKENKEVEEIRKKYLPKGESKLEELRRLDRKVQNAGMIESLSTGIFGSLIFGLGLCLVMQVIGNGAWWMAIGLLLMGISTCTMLVAYPIYRRLFEKTKRKLVPRILELSDALSGEKNIF